MTLEQRLSEALHQADRFEPSVDLFARFERSLAETRAHRRRVAMVTGSVVAAAALIVIWIVGGVVTRGGVLEIEGWRMVVAELAIAVGVLIALGPNLRRFGSSFVDEVFHLNVATGSRFLSVLDFAYYTAFTGLILVDADAWDLSATLPLAVALDDVSWRLGSFLLIMGVLHTINIVALPVLGIVFNSLQRLALRHEAGVSAPPESPRARRVDQNAKTIVIVILVLAVALGVAQVVPVILLGLG